MNPPSIVIRDVGEDDANKIAEIYAPYVVTTPISFEDVPPSAEEMLARIRKITQSYP